jgi:hypothetical protein
MLFLAMILSAFFGMIIFNRIRKPVEKLKADAMPESLHPNDEDLKIIGNFLHKKILDVKIDENIPQTRYFQVGQVVSYGADGRYRFKIVAFRDGLPVGRRMAHHQAPDAIQTLEQFKLRVVA